MANVPPLYERFLAKAKKLAEKTDLLIERLTQADDKVNRQGNKIGALVEDLKALIRLIRAWAKKQYKEVPTTTIISAIAAVIYFVAPFDLIPDWIPVGGYVDDAALVKYVIISIAADIERFIDWEKKQGG